MTIYLDHNATTAIRPQAAEAVARALGVTGNASSVHGAGRAVRKIVEGARDQVAGLIGARSDDVIFTSGGTEANNLALANGPEGGAVLVSAIEHASVLEAAPNAAHVPVAGDGRVDPAAVEQELKDLDGKPALVSVMLANNETGVIQPVAEIALIAERFGAVLHCDAVQVAGKIDIDMPSLGVHMLTLSAHKLGGPQGTGALVIRPGVKIAADHLGGGQERSRRAGTENIAGIAGFGAAAEAAAADVARIQKLAEFRDDMERALIDAAPKAQIFGREAPRLANTSCIAMPGVSAETQIMAFDLDGIAVSAGSACSSGKVEPSHVLRAMGAGDEALNSGIRVSMGWTTTADDITTFTAAWKALYARLGAGSLAA